MSSIDSFKIEISSRVRHLEDENANLKRMIRPEAEKQSSVRQITPRDFSTASTKQHSEKKRMSNKKSKSTHDVLRYGQTDQENLNFNQIMRRMPES